jgi:hypothetical protein
MKLPNLRQTLLHQFLDGEGLLGLLISMHSTIVVGGCLVMADWAGKVPWLTL